MKNTIGSESNRRPSEWIQSHYIEYNKLLYGFTLVQFDDRMRMKNCYKCCHIVFAAKVNRDFKPFSLFASPPILCFFFLSFFFLLKNGIS